MDTFLFFSSMITAKISSSMRSLLAWVHSDQEGTRMYQKIKKMELCIAVKHLSI
jgi:hypothetical protein